MIAFFANLFGYVLNFLYTIVGNFGLAIILFSILVKAIMIPISISQQKTMKKSQKINDEMKQLQFKYKNDPEKFNQEMMALYKREKMSPFSGCLSAIIQIILLFSVFYLVRSPLTYMKKIDSGVIEKLEAVVQESGTANNYKEIAVVNYIGRIKNGNLQNEENAENNEQENIQENVDENNNVDTKQDENQNVEESAEQEENLDDSAQDENSQSEDFNINDYIDEAYINMEFLGLDLSKVPTEDLTNIKTLIIPILYVISSIVSIKLSTNMTNKKQKENATGEQEYDPMAEANKSMSWFMPLMSVSIALIAPLGLALYWLMNNILMIFERIILDKFLKENKEEAEGNA